jgi:hypothetical protein
VPTSFYDVVVLGTHLEPLLCAALLARKGLRVLVLGQGAPNPSYTVAGVDVEPHPLLVTGAHSPIVENTLEDLALRQDVRQRMVDRSNALQLLLPEQRIDVHAETERWLAELARELPAVRRQAADVTRTLGEVGGELDRVMRRGLVWPPETFLERQQFSLATTGQRYDRQGQGWTSWNQLAMNHPLRTAFEAVLPHVSGLLPAQHSDATRARLHAHLLSGVTELAGGWTWFREALFARIRSWGSDVRPRDRADSLQHRRRGHTIRLTRTEEEIGCSQVVHGTPISDLSQLLPERAPMTAMFERVGEPRSRAYRSSVHLLLDKRGVPDALEPLALLCTSAGAQEKALLIRSRDVGEDRVLLTANRLIEEHLVDTGSSPLRFIREEALDAIRSVVPFLDDHAVWIDSPHDGLPPQALRGEPELSCSDPWTRGPYTMRAIYEYPTRRALGVCALPTRTPVRGVFLCNEQVAPGLGFEGAFLTATSVAKIIGSAYRKQDWLRRGPWARRSV